MTMRLPHDGDFADAIEFLQLLGEGRDIMR